MSDIADDLYRDVILDHFKSPRNRGKVASPDVDAHGANPLCGDEVNMTLKLSGGRVAEIKFEGHGCAISQASVSMMTEVLKGMSLEDVRLLAGKFKAMLLEGGAPPQEGDLETLAGVKNYPVRLKCALLAWNTLLQGLEEFAAKKAPVSIKHEEK